MRGRDDYDAISTSCSCASGMASKPDLSNLAKPFLSSWCSCSKVGHCSQVLPLPISQEPSEAGYATSSISCDALHQILGPFLFFLLPISTFHCIFKPQGNYLTQTNGLFLCFPYILYLILFLKLCYMSSSASLPIKILSYTHNKFQMEAEPSVQNQIIVKLERKKIKWSLNVLEWETISSGK